MTGFDLPAGLKHRPLHPDDAQRWAVLLAAAEAVDGRGEHYDADDCAEELAEPGLDLERNSCLVLDGDEVVAYQVLHPTTGGAEGPELFSEATVHPAHRRRGIGGALLATARDRAAELGARLTVRSPESGAGAVALAEATGMAAVRWWSEMERGLAEPIADLPLPDGLRAVPLGPGYDAARWDEPLRAAYNSSFADHWGSSPISAEAWAHRRTATRAFRPGCSMAALTETGGIAGFVLAYEYEADTARTGRRDLYVATVGTAAAHRGRGVAGALLAMVLRAAREQGLDSSSLTVDTRNPTGALGVYERAGYRVSRREITFALDPPPTPAS